MERAPWIALISFLLMTSPQAFAGTVFAAVDQSADDAAQAAAQGGPIEHFPESHFGSVPVQQTGASTGSRSDEIKGFAAHEAKDLDTSDEQGGSRSPASMEYGSGDVTQPVARSAPPTRNLPGTDPHADEPKVVNPIDENELTSSTFASAVDHNGIQEVAVIASDLGYFPRTVFVARDVPVRIFVTGASKNTLCIMMDSFQVRKQIRAQKIEEITFTPGTPGKYRFYCPVNGMEGTLVVKEFSTGGRPVSRVTASNTD